MNYQLLTLQNHKTSKGEEQGFMTALLFLSPADESGLVNMCPMARTCKDICLNTSGRNIYGFARAARVRRTKLLVEDRKLFLRVLRFELEHFIGYAERKGFTPLVRPNGLSDQAWLGKWVATEFPSVQCYDYTKLSKPWLRTLPNYALTFSYDGTNGRMASECLNRGVNVAVVFKGKTLPESYFGVPVFDGDRTDLRFLDPKGVVVGLKAKGKARHSSSAFVVEVL